MPVYTTILANYLFWIAQYTMIFLWSPRKWQDGGMWAVQCNKLKADITLDSCMSSCSLSALTLAAFHSPLLWATPTTDYCHHLFLPSSLLAELCWTWQPTAFVRGCDWCYQRRDSELHSHSLSVQHTFRFCSAAHSVPKHLKPWKWFCQNSAKFWFPQTILISDFSFLNYLNSIRSTFANLEWLFHCWHDSSELISRTDKEASGTEN